MKEKNFARSLLSLTFASVGLCISIPLSYGVYYLNNGPILAFADFLSLLPQLFGKIDPANTRLVELHNMVIYSAIVCVVAGFLLGELIKLVIKASRRMDEPTKGS